MTVLGNTKQLNQFKQSASRGTLDELGLNNTIGGLIVNDDKTLITSAGDLVVARDGANGVPTFREVLNTDTNEDLKKSLKGFVVKSNTINDGFNGIALQGSVMRMIASENIDSGKAVAYDVLTGKIVANPSVEEENKVACGYLLDTAKTGQVVRVYIQF